MSYGCDQAVVFVKLWTGEEDYNHIRIVNNAPNIGTYCSIKRNNYSYNIGLIIDSSILMCAQRTK